MDDLINQIVEKTGVTAQQARDGVGLAIGWVKEKLPTDVVDQLGSVLDSAGGMAADAVGKAKDTGASATSAAGSTVSSAADVAGSIWDKGTGAVSELMPGDE
jgi:hypothetical protein